MKILTRPLVKLFSKPLFWFIGLEIVAAINSNLDFAEILCSIIIAPISLWFIGYPTTDIFHFFNHEYNWIGKKWHKPHHSCFKADASIRNLSDFRRSRWSHDLTETCLMLLVTSSFTALLYVSLFQFWHGGLYGCLHAVVGIYNAVRIGCGDLDHFHKTDLGHQPQIFHQCPSEWFVNNAAHWRHHISDVNAYFGGKTTIVDKMLGTATSLKDRRINCLIANADCFLNALEEQGAKIKIEVGG